MDFSLTDEQQAAVDLARQILTDRGVPERLTEVEAGEDRFDRELWTDLAKADLLGLCLPEGAGGGGFGFLEASLLLYEQGRSVTPIPWWSAMSAAMAIGRWGDEAQQQAWLPSFVDGSGILVTALSEADGVDPTAPAATAKAEGDGYVLHGAKTAVPFAHVATGVVLTALVDGEPSLFVVPLDGVSRARQDTFNHEPHFHLDLDGVKVGADARLSGGAEAVGWLVDRATVLVCAVAAGVAEHGLHITAEYATNRHQFERPIATFQAVGQRMADGFIDTEAVRLSMLQAATLLADEHPAAAEVAVAKFWASQGGSRVGHTGLHIHGGISIDLDYPIHRHFLWSKQLEFTLGSGNAQLASLGAYLADTPV
jgi:alkylation response protein AidB-like acyl-CoA dehydrogenase